MDGLEERLLAIAGRDQILAEQVSIAQGSVATDTARWRHAVDRISDERDALHALDLCISRLRPGGFLIGDNVLCNALVLEEDAAPTVRGIQSFNHTIMNHPLLESVIVPLRDGVALCRKKD